MAGTQLALAFFDTPGAGEVAARVPANEAARREKQGTVSMLAFGS